VRYADYSHGVRLVWHEVWIGDEPHAIADALADPRFARALSDEGAIRDPRRLLDPRPACRAAGWAPEGDDGPAGDAPASASR
jgi:hypothetical protein